MNTTKYVTDMHQDWHAKVNAARRLMESVLQAFTGTNLNVTVEYSTFPAYTDGMNKVVVSSSLIARLVKEIEDDPMSAVRTLLELYGVCYHELGHIHYTPPLSIDPWKFAKTNGMTMAANLLEDQRQEAIMVKAYPRMPRYFVPMILDIVLGANPAALSSAHPFVAGRKYLPADLRAAAKTVYKNPANADRIGEIIDEYVTLKFPYDVSTSSNPDVATARNLITEFHQILKDDDTEEMDPVDGHDDMTKNKPKPADKTPSVDPDEDVEWVPASAEWEYDDSESEESEDGDGSGAEGSSDDPEEDGDGSGAGSGEDGSESDSEGSEGESEEGSGDTPAHGAGGAKKEDVSEAASQAMAEFLKDSNVLKEFQQSMVEYDALVRDRGPITTRGSNFINTPLPAHLGALAVKVRRDLHKIQERFAPKQLRRQHHGDLNVVDFKTRQVGDGFNNFDRKIKGHKMAAAVECVLVVDYSLSTNSYYDGNDAVGSVCGACSRAAWVIKRAIDGLPYSHCTVFAFSDHHDLTYSRDEHADPDTFKCLRSHNGTDPRSALVDAAKVFENSTAANKLMVLVTDGGFNDGNSTGAVNSWGHQDTPTETENLIIDLNNYGVMTALIGVGAKGASMLPVKEHGDHHCKFAQDMEGIMEIPLVVRNIVGHMLNTNKAGR